MSSSSGVEEAAAARAASDTRAASTPAEPARFGWIDPTLGYPDDTLIEGVRNLERTQYVAVRGGGAHKSLAWMRAHQSAGLEITDGHEWELATISLEGVVNGRAWVWGMYVEGTGTFNVMWPAEWVRQLTDGERAYYSGRRMGMYGSHSGELSYTLNLPDLAKADRTSPPTPTPLKESGE